MFAIVDGKLRTLPNSLTINGVQYTDLWTATSDILNQIGIYKLPLPPIYDEANEKLEVNLDTKSWVVLELTPDEKEQKLNYAYNVLYKRNICKYNHYMAIAQQLTFDPSVKNPVVSIQLQQYIVDLGDYCLSILNKSIPLDSAEDYPDPMLENYSNKLY